MGFISSATTVNVEATLTFAGKKRLYQLIEGDANFITRFGLGDSDTNYKVVPVAGALSSGYIPETGDFKPRMRSKVLWQGTFRPGKPVIFFDGEPGPVEREFSIGNNAQGRFIEFSMTTQWPTGEDYSETYYVEMQNPTSLSDDAFNRAFSLNGVGGGTDYTSYKLTFVGELSINELAQLVGEAGDASTDIVINVTGKKSNKTVAMNIRLIY